MSRLPILSLWLALACLVLCVQCGGQARASALPDPARVRSELQSVLGSPEFHPQEIRIQVLDRALHWLQEQWNAFVQWLKNLWNRLFHSSGRREHSGASPISDLLIKAFVPLFLIVAIWGLALLIRRGLRDRKPRIKPTDAAAFDIDTAEADMISEPDGWLERAHELAESGQYRRALRATFLAALLRLDSAGAVEYARSRTNGDYLVHLRHRGQRQIEESFGPLSSTVDEHWYGDRETGREQFEHGLSLYGRIDRQLNADRTATAGGG